MIKPSKFYELLLARGLDFFVGVPDSLLKDFCAYADDNSPKDNHVIAANEGNAISIAAGYYMASEKIPVVYMQNSGLGNCINPINSLADSEVYSIPMLLIIGWRGEPGLKDEPQHMKQGSVTEDQLRILGVDYFILDSNSNVKELIEEVILSIKRDKSPVALLVKKNSFAQYKQKKLLRNTSQLSREDAVTEIISIADDEDIFISTTGKTSRELYEIRDKRGDKQRDFLTVGSMGHTSSIALGVAIARQNKRVICLDGDGSMIMHMGNLPVIGLISPSNFIHVILNNNAHESVGGQLTSACIIDFKKLSEASNYKYFFEASELESIKKIWSEISILDGPILILINIKSSSRSNLGRPLNTPQENKTSFMNFVSDVNE